MEVFKKYKRKGLSEMRPYVKGEDVTNISIADVDNPETDLGMVARNPQNHKDQWYVAKKYFEENLELVQQNPLGMSFGDVITAMKEGYRVARKGWNGKGIFIAIQEPTEDLGMTGAYIYIDTTGLITHNVLAPKVRVPWLASQTDMLAEDWHIVLN